MPVSNYLRKFALLFFILVNFTISHSQDTLPSRPKVGLVLSGGAAHGIAHIGVLKVLEEAGLTIDYIGGTSMGAIMGGLYASGYSAAELESLVKQLDWDKLLSDAIPRNKISIEEKPDNDRFILSIPFRERRVSFPTGVISGQNIENTLSKLCANVYEIRDFNQLPIPFLCVGVDIATGEQVIFREGYLPDALRASMAIPTVFSAVEYQDKLLVDGGLVNNFPVSDVKEMGADILIGVDVGYDWSSKKEINDLFKVFEQSVFLASQSTNAKNRALCDLYIKPDLSEYGSSSFNSADSMVARGEEAARKIMPEIVKMVDSLNQLEYMPYTHPSAGQLDSILINEIKVRGLEKVSNKLLSGKLQLRVSEKYSPEDIYLAVERAYSSLYFDKVTWEPETMPDDRAGKGARLIVDVKEKKGIDLRLGLNYNTDFKASLVFNATVRNILLNGSRFSTTLGLGENPFIQVSLFKNNGWKPGFGLDFSGENYNVFLYKDNKKISTVRFSDFNIRLYTQSIISNSYSLGGGLEYESTLLQPGIGEIIRERQRTDHYNAFGFIQIDTYDDLFFPSSGLRFLSMYKFINNPEISPVHFFTFRFNKAIPLSEKITLIPSLLGGFSTADSTLTTYLMNLGGLSQKSRNGLFPFVGLEFMQKTDRNAAILSIDLQYNVWKNNYIILKSNAGVTSWNINKLFEKEHGFYGFGITLGNKSPVGPVEFTIMGSSINREIMTYFNIGYWF